MRNVVISNPELNQHMLRTNGGGAFPTFAFHSAKGCVDVNGNSSLTVPSLSDRWFRRANFPIQKLRLVVHDDERRIVVQFRHPSRSKKPFLRVFHINFDNESTHNG